MTQGTKVIVGLVVLVILVLLASVWLGGPKGDNLAAVGGIGQGENESPDTDGPVQPSTLRVDDQFPGRVAFISNISSPSGAWVVIKKDLNQAPGTEIGRKYFGPDVHIGNVDLSEATIEGSYYWAIMQTADGDQMAAPIHFFVTRDLPEIKG